MFLILDNLAIFEPYVELDLEEKGWFAVRLQDWYDFVRNGGGWGGYISTP